MSAEARPEEASSRAVASLVLGILSMVGCFPLAFGIAAIVLGSGESHGIARAGVILGWINVVLSLLALVFVILLFLLGGGIAALGGH